MNHYVYILASAKRGTLYIGVTWDLARRMHEHKNHLIQGFTQKYNVITLVYVENYSLMIDAVQREKRLKAWDRSWKINLIEKNNPDWNDLEIGF